MAGHDILQPLQADTSGPIDVGLAQSGREIGAALADAGKAIGGAIEDSRANKANKEFEDVVAQEKASALEERVDLPRQEDDNTALNDIQELLARQRFAIDQGQRSVVDRTTLELKTKMNELRAKWPRMADRLEQEIGQFVRNNAGFEALNALDVDRTNAAAAAKIDYNNILDEAKLLGIDMGINPPGTRRFATLYLDRSRQRQEVVAAELYEDSVKAVASRNAVDKAEDWRTRLIGAKSTASNAVTKARELGRDRVEFITKGTAASATFSKDFDLFLKQEAIDDIDVAIFQLQSEFDEDVSFIDRQTGTFAQVQTELDRTVEHLRFLRTAFESNDVTLLSAWEARELVRTAHLREQAPRMAQFEDFYSAFPKATDPKRQENFAKENKITQDLVGTLLNQSTGEWLASVFVDGGQGVPTAGMTPVQIRGMLRGNARMQPRPYGYPLDNTDYDEQAKHANANLGEQFNRLTAAVDEATPQGAAMFLNSLTSNIDHITDIPEQFEEIDKVFGAGMTMPNLTKLIDIAATDPQLHPSIASFGDSAQDQYTATLSHSQRLSGIGETVRVALPGGVSAHQLIKLTDEGIGPKGELTYVADAAAIKLYLENVPEASFQNLGITSAVLAPFRAAGVVSSREDNLNKEIERLATELSRTATENFQTQVTIFHAQNPQVEITNEIFNELFTKNRYEQLAQITFIPEEK